MAITVEARESAGLEAGAYEGKITDIIEENGQYGEQIKIVIDVASAEGKQQFAWASKTLSPQSKLWKWVKQVTGQSPQIGQTFDVEAALLGAYVGFLVSINDTGRSVCTDIFKSRNAAPASARQAAPGQATAAQPQQETQDVCCVPKCGRAVAAYDDEGNAFCERHQPEA